MHSFVEDGYLLTAIIIFVEETATCNGIASVMAFNSGVQSIDEVGFAT